MTVPPPGDELGHHVHATDRIWHERNRPLLALGLIVAMLCAIVVWLALTRHTGTTTPENNRQKINRLACEVVELGGDPVPGTRCTPTPAPTPSAGHHGHPTPHLTPAPASTVIVRPDGSTTTVLVPRGGSSSQPSSGGGHHPRKHHHHHNGGGQSPSPSPSPLVCITAPVRVCPGSWVWVLTVPLP